MNEWETAVIKKEPQREGFKFWYRNPSSPSQDSLGIAYEDGGEVKIVRPNFLFFAEVHGKGVAVDIVDPYGNQFANSLPRLKGMALYAEHHATDYRRIEVVAEVGGESEVPRPNRLLSSGGDQEFIECRSVIRGTGGQRLPLGTCCHDLHGEVRHSDRCGLELEVRHRWECHRPAP